MSLNDLEPSPNPSGKIIQVTQLILATATLLDTVYHLLSFLSQFHG
jgi:hypothetical protein